MQDDSYLALHNAYMCSGSQLLSLARRCFSQPLVCCNVHPNNLLLVKQPSVAIKQAVHSSAQQVESFAAGEAARAVAAGVAEEGEAVLVLLDIGCDWVPPDPYALIRYTTTQEACVI